MATSMDVDSKVAIDEGLYSRQLYVLGHEAMKRMSESKVLVVGLQGLGVEIAKNVILAGVQSLTLFDPAPAVLADLSSQFYLTKDDIGKPRAHACRARLADLNTYVAVNVVDTLAEQDLLNYQVVVLANRALEQQLALSEFAHKHGIKFIAAETRGVFASIFTDFGESFVVSDVNGEQPQTFLVANVTKEDTGIVTCMEDARHGLEDGDYVTFSEVQGMTELNGCEPVQVKVTGPFTFSIGKTSHYHDYLRGGICTQVKMPKTLSFKSLKERLEDPGEILLSDFGKFDRPQLLHVAFQALHTFAAQHGRLPRPWNQEDAVAVLKLTQERAKTVKNPVSDISDKLIHQVAFTAAGDLQPMTAVIGGVVAQEVLKAVSGKFHPIFQYFFFDATETLPESLSEADAQPVGSRYDAQIAVFGRAFQERLSNTREFLVGAGAIGCEMLKNWAMMGLGTGPNGHVFVTDMDSIERSNLSRQFLFRNSDVTKMKSVCAAAAVAHLNPDMHGKIKSYVEKVGPETEQLFNDDFFNHLDGVTNALDNVDARKYVDRRCVYYRKPLLESGTLGTKGNTQVVLPNLTESYSSSQDPPEKSFPSCTVKNFPYAIEHTIQWARDLFEGLFKNQAENVNAYLTKPGYANELLKQNGAADILNSIQACLVSAKPESFDDCVKWARLQFETLFSNQIRQLITAFPPDALTAEKMPFWSGTKRCPTPLLFDPKDPLHMEFVVAAANLYANNFGLPSHRDPAVFHRALETIIVPEFVPKSNVRIQVNENENVQENVDEKQLEDVIKSLPSPTSLGSFRMNPISFEKDDDTNFHIDFVAATANLRATNYSIMNADRLKIKGIAGKIIPAIATTTALVSGLVCLELYKLVAGKSKIEDYKNGFANLAIPLFAFSEPIAAPKYKYNETTWTLWDRFDIKGDLTVRELIKWFKDNHELNVSMISCGASMLFNTFMPKKKMEERESMRISQIVQTVSKDPIPSTVNSLILEVVVSDRNDEDVEVPYTRLEFR